MENDNCLIDLNKITLCYQESKVLDKVDFSLKAGEIVTLIGPNGAGKTSLLKIILGLITPSAGVVYKKKDIICGYVPQKVNIDKTLPLTVRRFLQLSGNSKSKINTQDIEDVLTEVGAREVINRQIVDISGGELQRVLLARALLVKPDLLVLDEPAQGVDIVGQEELYNLISLIRNRYSCGVLLVSHDLTLVMAKADRVVCLHKHVCCSGRPEDVAGHEDFKNLFGDKVTSIGLYTHKHNHSHNLHGDVVKKDK